MDTPAEHVSLFLGMGRNRIGRREKWPKQSWEEGEIGGKSREEGEKEKLTFREEGEIGSESREEGEIGSESREKGDLPPVPPPSFSLCVVLHLMCLGVGKGYVLCEWSNSMHFTMW